MEELKIDVKVDADDSQARDKINKLKKDFNDENLDIKINVGDGDIKSTIGQVDKLIKSLKELSNLKLGDVGNLESTLNVSSKSLERFKKTVQTIIDTKEELSKIKNASLGGLDLDKSNSTDILSSELKNNKDLVNKLEELTSISYIMNMAVEDYSKSVKNASDTYNKVLTENSFKENELIDGANSKSRLNNINRQIKELKIIEDAFRELGVAKNDNSKAMYEAYSGDVVHKKNEPFITDMAKSASEEEEILKMARELGTRKNELQKQIANNVKKLNESDKQIYDSLKQLNDTKLDSFISDVGDNDRNTIVMMLEKYLHDFDKVDLDFRKTEDIIRGIKRYQDMFSELKKVAGDRNIDFDDSFESIDADKLVQYNKELENALDNQVKIVSGVKDKIDSSLRDTTKKDSLFDFNLVNGLEDSLKSIENVLDSFNSKFSKAFTINGDSVASLNKIKDVITEINRLTESQKQIFFDMGLDDSKIKLKETKEDIEGINKATKEVDDNSFKGMISSLSKMEDATGKALSQIERLKLSASTEIISKFSFNEDGIKELDNKTTNINVAKRMKEIVSEYSKHANELMKTQLELDKALNSGASEQYVNELSNKINRITSDLAKVENSADEFKKFPEIFDVLNDSLRRIDDISLENKNLDSIKFLDAAKLKESNALLIKAKEAIRDINKYQIDLEKANNAGYNDKSTGIQSAIDERKKDLESYRSELEKNKKAITELSEYEVRKAREASNEIAGIRDKANKQTGTKTVDEQDVLLKKYKDGLLELQRIQKSIVKESVGSSREAKLIQLDATRKDLNNILNQLNDVKREAAKSFEIKIFNNVDRSLIDGLSKVSKEVDKIQDKFAKLGKSDFIDIDSTKFREATKEIERLQSTLSKGLTADVDSSAISKMLEKTEQLKKVSKDLELDIKIGKDADKIEQFTKNTVKNIEQMRKEFGELNGMDLKIFDELKNLEAGSDKLPSQMKKITQEMSNMNKEMKSLSSSGVSNFFDDLYDSMRTFTLGEMIGDTIQNGVYAIKEAVVGLDNAMRDMMKVAPEGFRGTSEELKQVKYDAIEVAKSVGQSTEEVIQGMSKALQTGATSMADALEIAKASATFANVGDLDQGQADTYIASIMSAFGGMENALKPVRTQVQGMGQDYNNLTNFLDMANHAGNNYAISTGDVGEALMRAGSVLSGFGVSMEDSVGMIVAANEAVQDSAKVGTGIKSIATNLGAVKASAKDGTIEMNRTAKALKEIAGIEVWNKQTGEVKDMTTTLNELNKVWDTSLTQAEKMALAEGIAGKNHINTFMALMDNWETVIQYQEEYNQGMMVGSAQKEQERYLDSIEGKWNKLRENLKSLTTTVLSSNMFKGLLDGATAFTDGLNTVFRALDEMNLALPTTIGLITSFGQMLRSFSGNGGTTNFLTSMIKGFKDLGKASKDMDVVVGKNEKSFNRLSKTTDGASKKVVSLSRDYSRLSNSTQRIDKNTLKLATSTKNVSKSFTQTSVGSKMAMVGTTLLNGALVTLAVAGISAAIKAFDNYIHKAENARKASQDNVDSVREGLRGYREQKSSLKDLADEYDKLASKQNKSSEEMSRFSELKKQIAEISPELVVGYDENDDPILKLNGSMEDYIKSIDVAIEKQKSLLANANIQLGKDALAELNNGKGENALKNKDDRAWTEQKIAILKATEELKNAKNELAKASDPKDIAKAMDNYKAALVSQSEAISQGYQKIIEAESEVAPRIQEVRQAIMDSLGKQSGFKEATDEAKESVSGLVNAFDVSDLDEAGMSRMISGINKSLRQNKGEIPPVVNEYMNLRNELEKTGQFEDYEKGISDIVPELASFLGVSEDMVKSFVEVPPSIKAAQSSLDAFLMTFGKREMMIGFDVETQNLAKTFESIQQAFDDLANSNNLVEIDGIVQVDPQIIMGMLEDDSLPDQLKKAVGLAKSSGGYVSEEEAKVLIKVLETYQRMGDENIDALLEEAQLAVDNVFGKGKVDVKDLKVSVDGKVDKANIDDTELQNALKGFGEGRESVRLLFETDVVGLDKVQLFQEIINKLPTNSEFTNKFIVDNADALSKMNSYKEVWDYLKSNPEVAAKYNINVDGQEKLDRAKDDHKELDGKNTSSEHTVETDDDEFQDTSDDLDSRDGNKTEEEYGVKVDKSDYESFKEDFKGNGDGTATLTFIANTEQAAKNISGLKQRYEELKALGGQGHSVTFTADTAGAAKNISGLMVRVKEYKTATSSIKSIVFKSETAGSAKNISGLIARVKQYQDAASSIKTLVFKSETAQSAKNISGLIKKVGEYNRVDPKTLTFKTNAPTITSQINNLTRAANSVPNGKTIKYNIQTIGSVPSGVSRSINTYASDIQAQTLGIQRSVQNGIDSVGTLNSTRVNPMAKISSSDVMPGLKYNVNLLQALEDKLKDINNQLDILDKKAKNAYGTEKINYIKQQNNLLKQQQVLQQSLSDDMLVQQRVYKDFLSGNGFTFSDDGSISNYNEKLLAYEKNLKALEDKSKNSDNDKVKAEYDATREAMDELKKALSSYLDLTFNDIPKASETWLDLDNQIKDNIDSIKELQTQLKYFDEKVSIEKYENELGFINKELDILDSKLDNMSGDAKIPVLEEQLKLYQQQQVELNNLANSYREVQSQLKEYLSSQGFEFDESGKIGNYDHLNNFAESENLEEITKALEEYINLTNNEIPALSSKWWDVEKVIRETIGAIKDTKEELNNISNEINVSKFQNEIGHIEKELDILDSKLANLSGQDKIDGLYEQISLYQKQQKELHNLANSYRETQSRLKEFLSNKGFQFGEDGKVLNYDNLQGIDASSYEEVKKVLEEYVDLTNNSIPELSAKWWDVEKAIKDVQDAIKELNYQNSLRPFKNALEEIGHALDRVNDKMDLLDKMYENVYGKDKLEYYDKKIALMEQEKKLLEDQYKEYLNIHHVMKGNLSSQYGVEFDDSSLITNYDEVLNKYAGHADYDKIKEQLDEYIDLVRNDIPENWKNWLDLENQIKEANKQKLETTKKIEDQITDIYKKQVEERKKLIDSELKKRLDALNKEKEAYNDARAEADYEKSYDKQKEIIDKLQSQIDTASKDTSLSGQKKLQELLEQLNQEQEKLEDMVQDKIDSDVNSMIDKESDRLQQEAEDAKDKLDKDFSDEKIRDLVKEALSTGVFEDIDGTMRNLQDVMLEFVDEYGDGLSAIGDLIKNEMITNLEIAKDTMKDLANIIKDLDLKQYSNSLGRMSMPEMSRGVSPVNNYSSPTLQFNQPLVKVDGNVTKDAIPDLKVAIKDALDEFANQLMFYTR
ncbi:MAG: phage tail tape measure protein [Cetobacterium sp.]